MVGKEIMTPLVSVQSNESKGQLQYFFIPGWLSPVGAPLVRFDALQKYAHHLQVDASVQWCQWCR
ncbi:MAG: hypothetical protein A3H31_00680 [Gallionellales bacterium RIFCSPLOWO2_02_FULL_57_47]|nr:MAG: hypothetical protein A3H31_00680 [Gallionellales bacterium RIFCSPLOWO2_02_FULL_57_47]OGT09297.1 MAG: hypothetical protein A3J49_12070 [Gallionellales bacterium RIFCSPHIGHO2_02_FULL_57_16]